jgi:hypothetical protein
VNGYKRADGGMHDPPPDSFRVEIIICDPRGHTLMPFSRSTLPEREHEGVTYERGRVDRSATLTGDGPDWRRMYVGCTRCPYRVPIPRARLEAALDAMWAPYAVASVRVVWDAPGRQNG